MYLYIPGKIDMYTPDTVLDLGICIFTCSMCYAPVGVIISDLNLFFCYIQVVHMQFTQPTFYFSQPSLCSVALQWFTVSTLKIVFIEKRSA